MARPPPHLTAARVARAPAHPTDATARAQVLTRSGIIPYIRGVLPPLALIRRSIGLVAGLGALSCALTMLFLSARTVMAIGGSCGSGGPYEIAVPCPDGIAWMVPVSILGGIVAAAVYAFSVLPTGPRLIVLAWPALFLSLGWAFLEAAFAPREGTDWGFLTCGVVFVLMGGAPLLLLLNRDAQRKVFWGPAPKPYASGTPGSAKAGDGPVGGQVRWTTAIDLPGGGDAQARVPRRVPASPVPGPRPDGLVGRLERLAALHAKGHLDDAEYAAAKKRLLEGSDG